eukprot:1685073-Lingulodinium_polyedra.AAC.1
MPSGRRASSLTNRPSRPRISAPPHSPEDGARLGGRAGRPAAGWRVPVQCGRPFLRGRPGGGPPPQPPL